MIDCTYYPEKAFVQFICSNPKVIEKLTIAEDFSEVVKVIDELDIKYTESQIKELEKRKFNK